MTSEVVSPPYRDRRAGLVLFGVGELLLGLGFLLLSLMSIFGMVMMATHPTPGAPAVPIRQMILRFSIYVVAGVVLSILGVGSMLARRWARDLGEGGAGAHSPHCPTQGCDFVSRLRYCQRPNAARSATGRPSARCENLRLEVAVRSCWRELGGRHNVVSFASRTPGCAGGYVVPRAFAR